MICIKRGGSAWKRGDGPRGAWQNDLMFIDFLAALRAAKVPVTLREYLTLMAAMDRDLAMKSVEDFYVLSRTILVKDERNFDRFDRVFATVFRGLSAAADQAGPVDVPADWLRALVEANLSEAERLQIAALGFDRLLETLRQRLREQNSRHQGGSKWIGTAGISPFGGAGYHPEGVRMGLERGRQKRAVRLWERREFRDLDSGVELGTRTMKLALRRLRKFARTGAREELDLPATIQATAERGYLDIRLRPERRNAVKVLLFFDAGGSMDGHVRLVEALFSAARSEFKFMQHFYFHNCLYQEVWKDNRRRHTDRIATMEILRGFPPDYRAIVVGDAAMSPYEISQPFGAIEMANEEPGAVWLARLGAAFPRLAWLNPVPEVHWAHTHSIGLIGRLMGERMYPLTLAGLDGAMRALAR
jgi:uncharacterized protein with von Willebrand factor type A (vWA) domain